MAEPRLLALNEELAAELGVDPEALRADGGVDVLAGNVVPDGASPVAQAYAGHQFGSYSPRLGDGRALLLGEVVDAHGRRRDLHLKGSGRDAVRAWRRRQGRRRPDAARVRDRRGDARARHPHLAGARRRRDRRGRRARGACCPARCSRASRRATSASARSSTRRMNGGPQLVRRLADHSIARHHPRRGRGREPVPRLLRERDRRAGVARRPVDARRVHPRRHEHRQHGDLGRDDRLRAVRVHGRLRPRPRSSARSITAAATRTATSRTIAQWNLARLAEALLPLIDDDTDTAVAAATDALQTFPERFHRALERRDARQARPDRGRRR